LEPTPSCPHRYGAIKWIGLLERPNMPAGDEQARRFFEDSGFATACVKGFRCGSPVLIAHAPEAAIQDAIAEVGGLEVDTVATVGTNLPMARVAGMGVVGQRSLISSCQKSLLFSVQARA
jgi:maleate isomerase